MTCGMTGCTVVRRAKVLKALLDREQLFMTDIGKSAFEAEARANMTHEWRLVFGGQALQKNTLGELMDQQPLSSVWCTAATQQQQ
jgi:hypothetical protein